MRLADFIPAFAAATCWEFSLAFLFVSRFISRRAVNGAFALLAFFLGDMNYFDLMLLDTRNRHADLIWYYLHYFSVFGIAAAWIAFLPLMLRCPLPRPFTPPRIAIALFCISLWQFSPSVLHAAPAWAPTDDFNAYVCGPFYGIYALTAIIPGFISIMWATGVIIRRRKNRSGEPPDGSVLWARDRDLFLIFCAAAAVVVSGTLELIQQLWWPRDHFSLNPRSLGTIVFCALTAWTLFWAMLRSKDQRQKINLERGQFDTLARARLQATFDLQHQIKNDLVAVELPLRNVLRQPPTAGDRDQQQTRISVALDEVQRLYHSLDVLLNAARLAAGEPIHLGQKSVVNVVDLVGSICQRRQDRELERRAGRFAPGGSQWECRYGATMDQPWVVLSVDDINHVLSVLLDNAVKYSPAGGDVRVTLWTEQSRLRLSVADEGIGIASSDLKQLGTRAFLRSESESTPIAGTGLGLFLARRLVEAQGGEFWADSALGSGSTFHVSLPLELAPTSHRLPM